MEKPFKRYTLSNGLRLAVYPMPHVRSACVMVFLGAGSRYESDAEAGVSHFIEHLYFKGTHRRRTSKEISEAIESIGGVLNGATDKELTTFYAKVADRHFPTAVDVLADLLHHSRLAPPDIDKERQIIIEEINMSLDLPQYKAELISDEMLWPGQPMGRDIAGSKATVSAMTRACLLDFISHRYVANNAVVAVAGNVDAEEARDLVTRHFGAWAPGETPSYVPALNEQSKPAIRLENRETEQAHILLACLAGSLFHPDRYALGLISAILGEGMSSRLFLEIREKQGLAYDIRSGIAQHLDTGSFSVYAGVDPSKVTKAVGAIAGELKLIKKGVGKAELDKAKEMARGRLLLRMEDSRNVAGWLGGQELLLGRILTVDEVVKKIDAVTADDIRRVANEQLMAGKLNLTVVGPVKNKSTLLKLLDI